jgi:hypothetical protein
MFENNHNGQNLAKIKAQVVSWRLTKHIREIPIISDWLYDLNTSPCDRFIRYVLYYTLLALLSLEISTGLQCVKIIDIEFL